MVSLLDPEPTISLPTLRVEEEGKPGILTALSVRECLRECSRARCLAGEHVAVGRSSRGEPLPLNKKVHNSWA